MRTLIAGVLIVASTASAEPQHHDDDDNGQSRIVHVSLALSGAAFFIVTETALKPTLAPSQCRFCSANSVDTAVRNALLWSHPDRASTISNVEAFLVAPMFAIGMTGYGALESGATGASAFDQVTSVVESGIYAADLTQVVKFIVGRQRPYAHFLPNVVPGTDDNVSFFSGHSSFTFALATSAGVIAHRNHYKTEPYIWAIGLSLAASTAYLRIAADKHYLTDVLVGSAVGVGMGVLVPSMTARPNDRIAVVPTGNGLGLVGVF